MSSGAYLVHVEQMGESEHHPTAFVPVSARNLMELAERLERLAGLVHEPDVADNLRQQAAECRMALTRLSDN